MRCIFAGSGRALALPVGAPHSHTDLRDGVIAMSPELPFILFLSGIVLGFFAGYGVRSYLSYRRRHRDYY